MTSRNLSSAGWPLVALGLFLLLSAICIVVMAVVLLRRGDERTKFILSRAALFTLPGGAAVLALSFLYRHFLVRYTHFAIDFSPLLYLGALAILFDLSYWLCSRKYRG